MASSLFTWNGLVCRLTFVLCCWFCASGQSLKLLCCVSLALDGDCNSLNLVVTCFLMPGHDTLFRYPWVMKSGQDGRLEKKPRLSKSFVWFSPLLGV
jgi:hypothetical protein